jgi:hypothetical protein
VPAVGVAAGRVRRRRAARVAAPPRAAGLATVYEVGRMRGCLRVTVDRLGRFSSSTRSSPTEL